MIINLGKSDIVHIFVMPKPDENPVSPFQGFTTNIFSDEYHTTLAKISCLPMNVVEVYMNREELVQFRSGVGVPSVMLLDAEVLPKRINMFKRHPFVFITCLNDEVNLVKSLDLEFDYPPTIVGIDEVVDVNLNDFNAYQLDDVIVEKVQEVLKNDALPNELKEYIESREPRSKVEETLDATSRLHAITRPNDSVMFSLGYKFQTEAPLVGGADKQIFIDAMVDSYRGFKNQVGEHHKGVSKSDLIVYSPSIFSHLYKFKSHFWNQINRQLKEKRAKEFIMNGIFKNPSYSGTHIPLENESDIEKLLNNKIVRTMLGIRQFELAYTTLAMCSLAIANVCPVIRLPNAINFHHGLINDIESLSKSTSQRALVNFNRKYKELEESIREEIGEQLIDVIKENESITLCTDAPLEWISIDRIPLMFTHEISKIHTTMGAQLLKTSMNFSTFTLEQEDLKKITVIRSFRDNDPIKPILEASLRLYIEKDNEIELKVVDVNDKTQFLDALNKVETKILIFDCHGNHGGSDSNGWLQIGNDQIDTWELTTVVPPIIILSACLTSAIGGSHASVANGLIENGALTVLGTLLPVDSVKSAAFVGRITYRLTGYLKALKKLGVENLTWRKFISDFFKMSFCTDILSELKDKYEWIDKELYEDIHIKTNFAINMNNKEWLDVLVKLISEKAGKSIEEVNDTIQEIGFVETMNYSQIGRPENIVIQLQDFES
ncbi:CHAT domain-containing protein [Vibrio parahaemolyticus]|uniref:CHAT domain-containing protein n=1 Tax=Vibrio parahaemolyticus TaxID=670 RepID=UPI001A24383F|nr:CHAT domain-containing protein [Vibrio parahaemolyticus]MBO0179251.1 hypothetical protein [Vibrio parahaemolyticus]MDG2575164.1 CHAT domain-containing protein [Vibrio parahaemolyticus]HAS6603264.1 hypothetical protein [Vibrio parahaemolyticus]